MSKPIIAVFSRDQLTASELPDLFGEHFDVRACSTIQDVFNFIRNRERCGLLADFRRISSTGNDEVELIESVQQRCPGIPMALLTPVVCPEFLEIWASTNEMIHFRGELDRTALLKVFGLLSPEQSKHHGDGVIAIDSMSVGALTGISRRFETNSPQLMSILTEIEFAANTESPILLVGEAGVGKTYLAKLIHEISSRRYEPFISFFWGTSSDPEDDEELFGRVSDSAASEIQAKAGKIIASRRGTLLLEEIDWIGGEQQAELLRLIETGEFEPFGSPDTLVCQAKLILTSSFSLKPLVDQGRFRPDLYFQLNTLKIVIPPLRHRKSDIQLLAIKFVRQASLKQGIRVPEVDPEVFITLEDYPWPGNVRELEYVLHRAMKCCRAGRLSTCHLPEHIRSGRAIPAAVEAIQSFPASDSNGETEDPKRFKPFLTNEKELIEQTFFQNRFSRTKAAKQLGISRLTLYNKMKRYL